MEEDVHSRDAKVALAGRQRFVFRPRTLRERWTASRSGAGRRGKRGGEMERLRLTPSGAAPGTRPGLRHLPREVQGRKGVALLSWE